MDNGVDFYLNDYRRDFYLKAVEAVKTCSNPFWQLKKDLITHIDKINTSRNVRTMYSDRDIKEKIGSPRTSYLYICYTKSVETAITQDLKDKLHNIFKGDKYSIFKCEQHTPKIISYIQADDPCQVYSDDPMYWNVHHTEFRLSKGHPDNHEQFWNILSDSLSVL